MLTLHAHTQALVLAFVVFYICRLIQQMVQLCLPLVWLQMTLSRGQRVKYSAEEHMGQYVSQLRIKK